MNHVWQKVIQNPVLSAASSLPPATVEETAWDILIALHSDRRCELSLGKLAAILSVPELALKRWLALLEDRRLITGTRHASSQELRALLTPAGRDLLDRYLSATSDLQSGAHQ